MNVVRLVFACHAGAQRRRVLVLAHVLMDMSMTVRVRMRTRSKTDRRSRLCPGRLDAAIPRRRLRRQRIKQLLRDSGHVLDRTIEDLFIRLRRFAKSAELADELQGRSADL